MSEKKSNNGAKTPRKATRNWATVVYPDSAPDDWKEKLDALRVAVLISPLHDKDVNPNGEPKKPHWHVLIMFDGPKDEHKVREIFDAIGGVGCEYVNSIRGYARYLCHMDNPEKHQYDIGKVVSMNGADFNTLVSLPSDKYKAIGEIIDFIEANDIYSYRQLFAWCRANKYDWFKTLCDNGTYVILEYLKSRTWEQEHPQKDDSFSDM